MDKFTFERELELYRAVLAKATKRLEEVQDFGGPYFEDDANELASADMPSAKDLTFKVSSGL
jgi:hypothetical protein